MSGPILVINPNSNPDVTAGLEAAVSAFRVAGGPGIECLTVADGPFGIESDADVQAAIPPLLEVIKARSDARAYVIACYSDPGITQARAVTDAPVYGMQASGFLTAMARGARVGVVAVAEASIPRHLRYLGALGVLERLAAERPLNMTVAETATGSATFDRLVEVAAALRDKDGADVIVLGCAGLSTHRAPLEAAIGRPIIDPTQAAVAMALGAALSG